MMEVQVEEHDHQTTIKVAGVAAVGPPHNSEPNAESPKQCCIMAVPSVMRQVQHSTVSVFPARFPAWTLQKQM